MVSRFGPWLLLGLLVAALANAVALGHASIPLPLLLALALTTPQTSLRLDGAAPPAAVVFGLAVTSLTPVRKPDVPVVAPRGGATAGRAPS
ncbi:MAG: hypothetical protein JF597_05910 [Streptomyces sp.]|uniref:hypothetical protein n=1 Tax=Streptomyces sp. TaxID=1931 RepID=UPI0025D691F0|nr:hypothetical protein [Streptomyces sp.]MBW8793128.1 hypothetical protein [Streptomyces sp.]